MSAPLPEAVNHKKRRRRRRKSRAPAVPLAFSTPDPPDPGPILGEREEKAKRLVEDVTGTAKPPDDPDDNGPMVPGRLKSSQVMVDIPVRFAEILAWYAAAHRITVAQAVDQILRSQLAKLKPEFRAAKTGSLGGSVRAADLGRVTD